MLLEAVIFLIISNPCYVKTQSDSMESEEATTTVTEFNEETETTTITELVTTLQPDITEDQDGDSESNLCKENEVYDCLPLCPPRCSLLSRIVCRKLHESIRKCRKGCTCKPGFKLDRMTDKCVKHCP